MYQNIADFCSNVYLIQDFDILVLSETWLNERINNVQLGLSDYNIRGDKSVFISVKSDGGGKVTLNLM